MEGEGGRGEMWSGKVKEQQQWLEASCIYRDGGWCSHGDHAQLKSSKTTWSYGFQCYGYH